MNIIRMTGGMGNQMFAYALYLKLCSMGKEVKLDDVSEYDRPNVRPIVLWAFDIDYPRASREEINEITDGFLKLSHRIRRKLFGRKSKEYCERDCNFDPQALAKETAYLTGYFQSEKYFKDIEAQVRRAFTFSNRIWEGLDEELGRKMKGYLDRIQSSSSPAAVHMRRGDYLEKDEIYGGICTTEYYKRAIAFLEEKSPDTVFFLFSNEPCWVQDWVCDNYGEDKRFVVVEGNGEDKGYLDMFLMSKCRHYIIANSSFSWWGAWLGGSGDKRIIAPAAWSRKQHFTDIYTEEMIRITAKGDLAV
ncbi:MAG: alpha-1,2-fucosyltransferase [Clostridium sp.]|nr:alpha-1,2-fucosyltransferase [Clostridium sp.]